MKRIYILLMHTNTMPAKLVKFFTRYPYSHVGISLEENCNILYSFGRKKVKSILDAGFSIEYKNGEFFKTFNKTQCKIYEISITNKQYEKVKTIIENMKLNSKQYKYDYLGIIPRFLGIPITLKNKYVCSYFVASVLEKANICEFHKKVCLVIPKDFEKLVGVREIYKGSYALYNSYSI